MTPLFQSDRRWSSLLLGNGPSTIGRAGCVLTALTMAARELGARPDLLPPHANAAAIIGGAFAGDDLVVPKAALTLGLFADNEPILGSPGDAAVNAALLQALANGLALVRVDLDLDDRGDHTILATGRNADGTIECLCPAVGEMQLSRELTATVSWGKAGLKKYRVVGVRGVHRPVT